MKGTKMEVNTEEVKNYFKNKLKEKFNEEKFNQDVKAGKKVSFEDVNDYGKEEDEEIFNTHGVSFKGGFKNGEYMAVGSNGHVIKSKNLDDFNRKLAQVFKVHAMRNGKEAICRLRLGKGTRNKKEASEAFARNFINAGVVVMGDVPRSPRFWREMKQNFLAKEGNTLDDWNRLTRFVPKEYMRKENSIQHPKNTNRARTIGARKTASFAMIGRGRGGR